MDDNSVQPGPSSMTKSLSMSLLKRKSVVVDSEPDDGQPQLKKRRSINRSFEGNDTVTSTSHDVDMDKTDCALREDAYETTTNDDNNTDNVTPTLEKQPTFSKGKGKGKDNSKSSHKNKNLAHKSPLLRIFSVQEDAEKLAGLLNIDNVKLLYTKIEKKRKFLNRVDMVTNELLDTTPEMDPVTQLEQDVETMIALFPDCDPIYLREALCAKPLDLQRVQNLSIEMFDNTDYPKLKVREENERLDTLKKKVLEDDFNVEEFLCRFPDPGAFFGTPRRRLLSSNYTKHVEIQLANMFPVVSDEVITRTIEQCKGHFTLAHRELEIGRYTPRCTRLSAARVTPRPKRDLPDKPDENFYNELMYILHEKDLRDHDKKKTRERAKRRRLAKQNGELQTCDCCCNDDILEEDMIPCHQAHLFCVECIRLSTEEMIGQARYKFPCLSGDPDCEYDSIILKRVLSPRMFTLLQRKIQEAEIEAAGIEDLVSCPFCTFASIVPNKDDKVFKCLNPECLKESCRLCREVNHVPLNCEEVIKVRKEDMKGYIQMKMSEAMIRVCYDCGKRFYRTEGCNMMQCLCGAKMCYVCRKPIRNCYHFGTNKCPQFMDVQELHEKEVKKGAKLAKADYIEAHPEIGDIDSDFDSLEEFTAPIIE